MLSALRVACERTAVLLIAHRASTVDHADRIVLLTDGRVTGEGTEAALRAGNAAYREFMGGEGDAPEPHEATVLAGNSGNGSVTGEAAR